MLTRLLFDREAAMYRNNTCAQFIIIVQMAIVLNGELGYYSLAGLPDLLALPLDPLRPHSSYKGHETVSHCCSCVSRLGL